VEEAVGHIRLGRLPKTRRWREVVELLDASPALTGAIAACAAEAADKRLLVLGRDPSFSYCYWLLTRIAWASRSEGFVNELAELGIVVSPGVSTIAFISQVADRVRHQTAPATESGHFSELGSLALRRALAETVGEQGGSLFGSSLEDLQTAFRRFSTQSQFGTLSHRFFADLFSRTLRSLLARELSNHIGEGRPIANIDQGVEFSQALDTYARQAARIMKGFAEGWYSKQNWESKGQISRDDAQAFVAVAVRKLRMELKTGDAVR
jgi:hypothetical protein